MPTIKRRAPIKATTDLGPSPGAVFGRGLQEIGGQVSEIADRRDKEDQESNAFDDYMLMEKDYQEYEASAYTERLKSENYDGLGDEISEYRKTAQEKYTRKEGTGKHYRKTLKKLMDAQQLSRTDSAIVREESGRLEVKAARFSRNESSIIQGATMEDLFSALSGRAGGTYLNKQLNENMSVNSIVDNDATRLHRDESMKKEFKSRLDNATPETRGYYDRLLDNDEARSFLGNDYYNVVKKHEQNMSFMETNELKASALGNSEMFKKQTDLLTSLSGINANPSAGDLAYRNKLSGGKEVSREQLLDAGLQDVKDGVDKALESGEIDETTARNLKNLADSTHKELVSQERAPLASNMRSAVNQIDIEIKGLRKRISDAGDDEELKDELVDEYLSFYRDMIGFTVGSSGLPLDKETLDKIESMVIYAEMEIGTELANREKSFWLRSDIDSGDTNRMSTHTDTQFDRMRNDTYTLYGHPQYTTVEKSHIMSMYRKKAMTWQSERNIRRGNKENVPDLDVMRGENGKTGSQVAAELSDQWMQESVMAVLGDSYEKRMAPVQAKQGFFDTAQAEYDRDDSPNKENFKKLASKSNVTPNELSYIIDQIEGQKVTQEANKISEADKEIQSKQNRDIDEMINILSENGVDVNAESIDEMPAEKLWDSVVGLGKSAKDAFWRYIASSRLKEVTSPTFRSSDESVNERVDQRDFERGLNNMRGVSDANQDLSVSDNEPSGSVKSVFPTKHPFVSNDDGSKSNVILGTFEFDGNHVVIPTMVDGKKLSDKEAVSVARENGLQHYPTFDTAKEADRWAEENHSKINENGEIAVDDAKIINTSAQDKPSGSIHRDMMTPGSIQSKKGFTEDDASNGLDNRPSGIKGGEGVPGKRENKISPVVYRALDTIAAGESFGGSVDAMNQGTVDGKIVGGTKDSSTNTAIGKKISTMSISEVMSYQAKEPSADDRIFAAGKYQIIPTTLEWAVNKMGIDKSKKFDLETQDAIGEFILMTKQKSVRDFINGKSDDIVEAMIALHKEWRSFAHPTSGKKSDGKGNSASHSVEDSRKLLLELRESNT